MAADLPLSDGRLFHAGKDGNIIAGAVCPDCGHDVGTLMHLEPLVGAMVRCAGTTVDPDWGVRRPCGREHLVRL